MTFAAEGAAAFSDRISVFLRFDMVFSSYSFLFLFFPALLLCYFVIPGRFRRARNGVLLLFSLLFYACGGVKYLLLMLLQILIDYFGGLLCANGSVRKRKTALFLSVGADLLLLVIFKYLGFLCGTLQSFGLPIPVPELVLPIGISFYTFQGISYVVDVYRGETAPQKNPFRLALYIALFPQLIAGPIVRYQDVEHALSENRESLSLVSDGLVRFCFGLAKKLLLAGPFGALADEIFGTSPEVLSAPAAWIGALAYTMQIYFDFSGYSDMAIGLGRVFGFSFPENFRAPYTAVSVTDFWRRWHISLSSWFRDYVYIPLGGSRTTRAKHIRNLLVVWLLTGLWHGADWTFLLWGLWYGLLLLLEKFVLERYLSRAPYLLRRLLTLLAVVIGWVIFRAESLPALGTYLRAMAGFGGVSGAGQAVYGILEYLPEWFFALFTLLPWQEFVEKKQLPARLWFRLGTKAAALMLFVLSYAALVTGTFNPFLYYRF